MELKIGKRAIVPVADLAEASREYQRLRDESGEGGSTWPDGKIVGTKFRVSYNGRVWEKGPGDWKTDRLVMEAVA